MFVGHSAEDEPCKLECITKAPPTHEFEGPVKIVLIDIPSGEYKVKMCLAGLIGLAYVFIGVEIMTMYFYTLKFEHDLVMNLHIIVCSTAYLLCLPMGVLMMNPMNGPAAILKLAHRKLNHALIQLFGVSMGAIASALLFLLGGIQFSQLTPHCYVGIATVFFSICCILLGPSVLAACKHRSFGKCIIGCHVVFGLLAMLSGALCFDIALWTLKLPLQEMTEFLLIFNVLSTIIVIIVPLLNITNSNFEQ